MGKDKTIVPVKRAPSNTFRTLPEAIKLIADGCGSFIFAKAENKETDKDRK
jgi:hypothetical protein